MGAVATRNNEFRRMRGKTPLTFIALIILEVIPWPVVITLLKLIVQSGAKMNYRAVTYPWHHGYNRSIRISRK